MASQLPNLDQPRSIIAATLVVAAVTAGFGVAYLLSDVLFLLFIGVVLATALEPAIAAFRRRRVPQSFAVGAVYAGVIVVLAVAITVGMPFVITQSRGLATEVAHANQQALQRLAGAGDVLWAKVARRIVAEFSASKGPAELEQTLATVGQTASYLAMAARGLLVACAVVLLAFYWSLQGDRTVRWLLLLLPVARRDGARDTIAEIEGKVGAYLGGQCLVCLAMVGRPPKLRFDSANYQSIKKHEARAGVVPLSARRLPKGPWHLYRQDAARSRRHPRIAPGWD